jgi:phage FluMu protein Com
MQLTNEFNFPRSDHHKRVAAEIIGFLPRGWIHSVASTREVNSDVSYNSEYPGKRLKLTHHTSVTVKSVRETLLEMVPSGPLAYESFDKFQLTNLSESNPFLLARKAISTPRDKFFKYRILQGDVFCNKRLHKFKMSPTPNCNYCLNEVETIKHLIWECPRSNEVWQIFNSITMQTYNINYVTYDTIVLGPPKPVLVLEALVLELLKLIMRRDREDRINEVTVKNHILLYYKIEKIAMGGREREFRDRWHNLNSFVNP